MKAVICVPTRSLAGSFHPRPLPCTAFGAVEPWKARDFLCILFCTTCNQATVLQATSPRRKGKGGERRAGDHRGREQKRKRTRKNIRHFPCRGFGFKFLLHRCRAFVFLLPCQREALMSVLCCAMYCYHSRRGAAACSQTQPKEKRSGRSTAVHLFGLQRFPILGRLFSPKTFHARIVLAGRLPDKAEKNSIGAHIKRRKERRNLVCTVVWVQARLCTAVN